jgi:beta-galactosidase
VIRSSFNHGWEFRLKARPAAGGGAGPAPYQPVTLPHDAMIGRERDPAASGASGFFPGGTCEYRKVFHVPGEYRDKRVILEFEGVYRDAMVYINGDFAGQRPYGYSPIVIRAGNFLRYGADNEVLVMCRAHQDSRWYSGAGIYRPVHLIVAEQVHIALDGVRVTTPDIDPERAVVTVATVVENEGLSPETVEVRTELRDMDGSVVAAGTAPVTVLPGEPATVRQRLYVKHPALWSTGTPALYTATVTLPGLDSEQCTFGIRRLQLDPDHGLRLNGEIVKLRGACIHHDNGVIGAVCLAGAEQRRVRLLKEAGFNAIRSAHNPAATALLQACDRLGMLVIDEAFDTWTLGKSDFDYSLSFPTWWERDIEAMVRKDLNHPSVITYSTGNEVNEAGRPLGAVWGRRLAEKIRSLDGTRYVTNAVYPFAAGPDPAAAQQPAETTGTDAVAEPTPLGDLVARIGTAEFFTRRTAESFAVLDIAGMNYLDARYEMDRAQFPGRIIVGTETFPPHIDVNWTLVQANSHVIGDFTWTGWDYLGEAGVGATGHETDDGMPAGSFPWLVAHCGDIDITGHRRPASYYRQIVYGLRREPYIAVHRPAGHGHQADATPWAWTDTLESWSWEGFEGKPVTVEVYADAGEIELTLNGESLGKAAPYRFRAEFETIYQPGELTAIAYTDGREQGRTSLVSASGPPRLSVRADRPQVRADDTDLAYVAIALADDRGNLCNQCDRPVTIEVTGPGALQGLGSARPVTEEVFTGSTHTTYDGRALAVIRPTGPGEITVTVSAPGCDSAEVAILAR